MGNHMSTKDCVAAVAHIGFASKLVAHSETGTGVNSAHEVAKAYELKLSINLAGLVTNADDHDVTATVPTGLLRYGGKDFLIIGTGLFPLDELRLQGVVSGSDASEFAYVSKYLRKAVAQA